MEIQAKVRSTENLRANSQVGQDLNTLISVLESPVFQSILNIQGIEVHNNPWQCDCQLQEFTRWVHLTAVPRVAEPRCQQPLRLQVQQPCVKVMGMMGMMMMIMMIMMMMMVM